MGEKKDESFPVKRGSFPLFFIEKILNFRKIGCCDF